MQMLDRASRAVSRRAASRRPRCQGGEPAPRVPRRRACSTCRRRRSTWCRSTSAGRKADPELSKLGGTAWGQQEGQGRGGGPRPGRRHDPAPGRARRPSPASPSRPTPTGSASSRPRFPYQETPDQLTAIAEIKARPAEAAADGPPDLRRRRLRQDRGGHPGRVQGGRQRQAGGGPRADDRARRAALPHLHASGSPSTRSSSRCVSRFRTAGEQKRDPQAVWPRASVDVIVGTHRLVVART